MPHPRRRSRPWAPGPALATSARSARLVLRPPAEPAPLAGPTPLVLEDATTGERIGQVVVGTVDPATASAGLTVDVVPARRRRGVAAEGVAAALSLLLGEPWGLSRVHLEARGADVAARGLARRLGLRQEVRRRQHVAVDGPDGTVVDDLYGWGVLADEWDVEADRMRRDDRAEDVGVGPHPRPWPEDPRYDPLLLRDGDRRNVADRYRWWRHEAIVADLAAGAHPFHVAIENWHRDMNIGTVVRNANAFGAAAVHVVGRRSWNRRGAMVTDRYLDVRHHADVAALAAWAAAEGLPLVGVDNLPGSVSIFEHPPPRQAVLLLGQEGPGLSDAARSAVEVVLHVPQVGSTRSINAGVASGIAMAAWLQRWAPAPRT